MAKNLGAVPLVDAPLELSNLASCCARRHPSPQEYIRAIDGGFQATKRLPTRYLPVFLSLIVSSLLGGQGGRTCQTALQCIDESISSLHHSRLFSFRPPQLLAWPPVSSSRLTVARCPRSSELCDHLHGRSSWLAWSPCALPPHTPHAPHHGSCCAAADAMKCMKPGSFCSCFLSLHHAIRRSAFAANR
eukprot:1158309-Pelagomonas_calceolata.AAC.19